MILRPVSPAHGGAAIARDEGKVWLVNYALPGEVVEAEPRGKQGGVAVANAVHVLEASPHRVAPKCPHFGDCGGCQLQHAAYSHQLELKRQVVEEAWARAGLRLPPDTPVLGMDDPWRYRIRGEFEAVPTPAGWRFGFHRLRSHSVLAIDTCPIHELRIEQALPAFAQAANELAQLVVRGVSGYVSTKISGLLAQIRSDERDLASTAVRLSAFSAALPRATQETDKLFILTQTGSLEQRQVAVQQDLNQTRNLLALARNVEASYIVTQAVAQRVPARSRRNAVVIGAFVGLILGLLAALLWKSAPRLARRSTA